MYAFSFWCSRRKNCILLSCSSVVKTLGAVVAIANRSFKNFFLLWKVEFFHKWWLFGRIHGCCISFFFETFWIQFEKFCYYCSSPVSYASSPRLLLSSVSEMISLLNLVLFQLYLPKVCVLKVKPDRVFDHIFPLRNFVCFNQPIGVALTQTVLQYLCLCLLRLTKIA